MPDSLHILVNLLNAAVECRAAEELQRLRQSQPQRVPHWNRLARGRSCGDGEYIPSERVAAVTCQFDARGVADGETLPQFPSESAIGEVPLFFFYPILLFECQ
jgi:hypothetical protein